MPNDEWERIISIIKILSGKPIDHKMSLEEIREIQKISDYQRDLSYVHPISLPRIEFELGLSDSEIKAVEEKFNFQFPPDLREFLQIALPHGKGFPDWRSGKEKDLRDWLDFPREGILADIQGNFWLDEWGQRPEKRADRTRIANELIASAPKLIPIYGHRMMPDEPHLPGNPVFSVIQADIIIFGFDLKDYLRSEFYLPDREPWPDNVRSIRFWNVDRFQQILWRGNSDDIKDSQNDSWLDSKPK